MLRIRLRRVGKKKQPMYRIVVADSHAPRDGAFVESLGYYHPLDDPSTIVLDEERAKHWLDNGAMPSTRVAKILQIQGIAEVSEKVATRIALGEKRKEEARAAAKTKAAEAKVEAGVSEAEPATEAKAEEPATEAKAEKPAAEAKAEEPAAEAKAEEPAAEAKAEEPASEAKPEEPAAEAKADADGDASGAEADASAAEADAKTSDDEEKSEQ